jgi:hypothetical protein
MSKHAYFITEDQLNVLEQALSKLPGADFIGPWQLIHALKERQELPAPPTDRAADTAADARPKGPVEPVQPPDRPTAPASPAAVQVAKGAAATAITPGNG